MFPVDFRDNSKTPTLSRGIGSLQCFPHDSWTIEDFDGLPREFLVLRWIAHEFWRRWKLATQDVKSGFYGVSHWLCGDSEFSRTATWNHILKLKIRGTKLATQTAKIFLYGVSHTIRGERWKWHLSTWNPTFYWRHKHQISYGPDREIRVLQQFTLLLKENSELALSWANCIFFTDGRGWRVESSKPLDATKIFVQMWITWRWCRKVPKVDSGPGLDQLAQPGCVLSRLFKEGQL